MACSILSLTIFFGEVIPKSLVDHQSSVFRPAEKCLKFATQFNIIN